MLPAHTRKHEGDEDTAMHFIITAQSSGKFEKAMEDCRAALSLEKPIVDRCPLLFLL